MSSHYSLGLDNIGGESSEGPCLIAKEEDNNQYVKERSKCKRDPSIKALCLYGNYIYSELNFTVVY